MYPVTYPASLNTDASVDTPVGRAIPLRNTPVMVGQHPVCRAARAGAHTGWGVNANEKWVPARAIPSNSGVTSAGLPWTLVVSQRC